MSLNESTIEDAALEWFGAVRRLNPAISEEARKEALRKVLRVGTPGRFLANQVATKGDIIGKDGVFRHKWRFIKIRHK